MAQWDELQRDFPGVDANRLVRGDARVMAQPPSLWASRVQMLTVAHPEIDWVAVSPPPPKRLPHPPLLRARACRAVGPLPGPCI